ncbi:MAG: HAD family hydrolase [Vicinamibacterales bacterium]
MDDGIGRGVPSPLDPRRRIRGVLFDLDGTLYRQTPVRALMAVETLTLPLASPALAPKRWRALVSYRRALEQFREHRREGAVAQGLLATTATATGLTQDEVESLVTEWMHVRPLKYLRMWRASGIDQLLDQLRLAGVLAGVLSDYPAEKKLLALGLGGRFSPVLCSLDPAIDALKPSPRGFEHACRRWNLSPSEVLMIGDRADVDAAGALAAGMPCVIIGRGESPGLKSAGYLVAPSLDTLRNALAHD